MLKKLSEYRLFFFVYALFLLAGGIVLLAYSRTVIHLEVNKFFNDGADLFFKYITHLGDGLAVLAISLFLFFVSKRYALLVGVSGLLAGTVAQFLKRVVFGPVARPSRFFTDLGIDLHYIQGVELRELFSFPSGHAATAFALALSLAFILRTRSWQITLLALALLTGFSRIYLSQHFMIDVYFGSMIGCLSAIAVYYWLWSPAMLNKKGLDCPLFKKC